MIYCAGVVLSAHDSIALATPADTEAGSKSRIRSIRLRTTTELPKLKDFYHRLLELPVVSESSTEFTIQTGESQITFVRSNSSGAAPFYHFAFNIPHNKIRQALVWQRKRTPIIPTPTQSRDKNYPDEIRHFRHWNAHALFFLDPAGNVVEYIARHTLDNAAEGPFSSRDLLCVSEIAFVTDDVEQMANEIKSTFGLHQYNGGSAGFQAVGDEQGLLLVFERGRDLGSKYAEVFPTKVQIRGGTQRVNHFDQYPYELKSTDASS